MITKDNIVGTWLLTRLTDEEARDLQAWAEEHHTDLDKLVHQVLREAMAA